MKALILLLSIFLWATSASADVFVEVANPKVSAALGQLKCRMGWTNGWFDGPVYQVMIGYCALWKVNTLVGERTPYTSPDAYPMVNVTTTPSYYVSPWEVIGSDCCPFGPHRGTSEAQLTYHQGHTGANNIEIQPSPNPWNSWTCTL